MPVVHDDARPEDDPFPLRGRTALVTGAASGIGAAVAMAAATAGARVAALDVDGEALSSLGASDDLGPWGELMPVKTDVTDRRHVEAARAEVHDRWGPVDLVVANAGVMYGGPFESSDVGEWDAMIAVNVTGVLNTARAFVDDLLDAARRGRPADLVIVGSVAARLLLSGFSVYSLTAAARAQLARALRAELSGRGVRVRHVEPGTTLTALGDDIADPLARTSLEQMRSVPEPLTPADVAHTIVFTTAMPAEVNFAEAVILPTRQG